MSRNSDFGGWNLEISGLARVKAGFMVRYKIKEPI
jgi:hypothetical protein